MAKTSSNHPDSRRKAMAHLSRFSIRILSLGAGYYFFFKFIPVAFSINMAHKMDFLDLLLFICVLVPSLVIILFLSDAAWLYFVKLFLSKGDAAYVLFRDHNFKSDRWLFSKFFPTQEH